MFYMCFQYATANLLQCMHPPDLWNEVEENRKMAAEANLWCMAAVSMDGLAYHWLNMVIKMLQEDEG